jgi:deazaflavin-dependent oxidoreductase (nitroreductase family)
VEATHQPDGLEQASHRVDCAGGRQPTSADDREPGSDAADRATAVAGVALTALTESAASSGYVAFMPLRYVDPDRRRGKRYQQGVRFGRSSVGQFIARHVARRTDPLLFRLTGGRVNMGPIVNAPLRTTGAKSGQPREVQLTYFHDGNDVILVASNFGGTKHPQWYFNLKAHPDCTFGEEPFTATQVTDADEYARLFELAERVYAGYTDYREKTADTGREIPIFRLSPR